MVAPSFLRYLPVSGNKYHNSIEWRRQNRFVVCFIQILSQPTVISEILLRAWGVGTVPPTLPPDDWLSLSEIFYRPILETAVVEDDKREDVPHKFHPWLLLLLLFSSLNSVGACLSSATNHPPTTAPLSNVFIKSLLCPRPPWFSYSILSSSST